MTAQPQPGDRVLYRCARNKWHEGTAATSIEGTHDYSQPPGRRKIHDFPVVWIEGTGNNGNLFRAPWPASDVEVVES